RTAPRGTAGRPRPTRTSVQKRCQQRSFAHRRWGYSDHRRLRGSPVYCGVPMTFWGKSATDGRFTVHSVHMSGGGGGQYYWCLFHHRVETDDDSCPGKRLLGPFQTRAEAERALEKVAERNAEWDAEDARCDGLNAEN